MRTYILKKHNFLCTSTAEKYILNSITRKNGEKMCWFIWVMPHLMPFNPANLGQIIFAVQIIKLYWTLIVLRFKPKGVTLFDQVFRAKNFYSKLHFTGYFEFISKFNTSLSMWYAIHLHILPSYQRTEHRKVTSSPITLKQKLLIN